MKQKILDNIYTCFDNWAKQFPFVCEKGCDTCCTQNVMISALEGELILNYIRANNMEQWLADKLNATDNPYTPEYTTNQYAAYCIAGEEIEEPAPPQPKRCPFLENGICMIYDARPFSCRSFNSEIQCSASQEAQTSETYLSGSTAVSQLIEHLGQGEYWGNMIDMLCTLTDISANIDIAKGLNPEKAPSVRAINLKTAVPLPGFLILEEEWPQVNPLLEAIFSTEIDHRTIEEIFNGKK